MSNEGLLDHAEVEDKCVTNVRYMGKQGYNGHTIGMEVTDAHIVSRCCLYQGD